MRKRGKVLRLPTEAPGLLIVEGQQFRFFHDSSWKSVIAPAPGLVVDVELSNTSQVVGVTAVEQPLATSEPSTEIAGSVFATGIQKVVETVGTINLVTGTALTVGWLYLTNVSIQVPLVGKLDFTFWQVLGLLNCKSALQVIDFRNGQYATGLYGFFALAVLIAPFLRNLWQDRRTLLGGFAPLLFTLVIWTMARSILQNAAVRAVPARSGTGSEMMSAISFGPGAYLSLLAALYFSISAGKQFLHACPTATDGHGSSPHAAA